ncbi:MAG: COX15/CtaA family protein [Pseudoxanthomonas suwonensis]|nr:COX15/CtaA family protein [Pseudoxanthomonas suwonensis]
MAMPYRHFHRIAWLAVVLATCVIVFGAFVRLSDAGLSCPDWPTCYGRATWPKASDAEVAAHLSDIRPVEPHKAWREQVHRHLAATLGLLVLLLAWLAARRERAGAVVIPAATALIAAAIPVYMIGHHWPAFAMAAVGEVVLLVAAVRWSNRHLASVGAVTLAVIVFQALLGMWTVTWLLKPAIVMAHLLGGLLTFALLLWMAWRATEQPIRLVQAPVLKRWLAVALALLGVQIALGGWVSANYAALSCGTQFPKCVGLWWPPSDFQQGFVLWRGIGVDYEGGVLDGYARIAIQLAHRVGAVVVGLFLLGVGIFKLMRVPGVRGWGVALVAATLLQIGLGITNVLEGLPLPVAVAHNAGAVLLLFVLVTLVARLQRPDA